MLAFLRDARGNTAVLFALAAIPITALIGASIDLSRIHVERMHLQSALDAAVLAAANMPSTTTDLAVENEVGTFLNANFNGQGEIVDFEVTRSGASVAATVYDDLPLMFPSILGKDEHRVSAYASAERGGVNLEVALVLDITASMGFPGSKISALQSAANSLVATILDNQQEGFTSRVALVPYSNSVNVGSHAAAVRGSSPAALPISGVACAGAGCEARLTITNHGFDNGDRVHITGMSGAWSYLNNRTWAVKDADSDRFTLNSSNYPYYGSPSPGSGGNAWCAESGCQYYYFTNASSQPRTFALSACVTERTGAQAYTDAAPAGAPAGRAYVPSAANCPASEIAPLTDNKTSLTNQINALRVSGSTAGQIGIAWGWYMLSPNFASLWPSANRPVAYANPETKKIAVIMTDGEFNTGYCNGVISRDSGWDPKYKMWVVPASERINCDATNGGTFAQAAQLCTAMKAAGIMIYTVAFDVAQNSEAATFMQNCATDPSYAYLASGSAQLQEAFADIGESIGRLRLTR